MKALVFQPHNDDAVIAIGGILQKLIRSMWQVIYVYVTDNSEGIQSLGPEESAAIRRQEALEEQEFLGIGHHDHYELMFKDNGLNSLDEDERTRLKNEVRRAIENTRADIVVIPSEGDVHDDHKVTHDLIKETLQENEFPVVVVKYSVWLLPDFYGKVVERCEHVYLVGIDEELGRKLDAIRCHRSQLVRRPHDLLAKNLAVYLAHFLKADKKMNSHHVEVIGIDGAQSQYVLFAALLAALSPYSEETQILHGSIG